MATDANHDALRVDADAPGNGAKLRILFLTQWFDPEPGATRGLPLAKWLIARGHQVEVVTGVPNYPGGKVYPGYKIRFLQRETMDEDFVIREFGAVLERPVEVRVLWCGASYAATPMVRYRIRRKIGRTRLVDVE